MIFSERPRDSGFGAQWFEPLFRVVFKTRFYTALSFKFENHQLETISISTVSPIWLTWAYQGGLLSVTPNIRKFVNHVIKTGECLASIDEEVRTFMYTMQTKRRMGFIIVEVNVLGSSENKLSHVMCGADVAPWGALQKQISEEQLEDIDCMTRCFLIWVLGITPECTLPSYEKLFKKWGGGTEMLAFGYATDLATKSFFELPTHSRRLVWEKYPGVAFFSGAGFLPDDWEVLEVDSTGFMIGYYSAFLNVGVYSI